MGEISNIAWTDATFNPWWGCTRVSPGCEHCYAERLATVRRKLPVWGVDAQRKPMSEAYWRAPLKWNRESGMRAHDAPRRRVFCASMADVFERPPERNEQAWEVMQGARVRLWKLIADTPHLDWLLLTKRPENVDALVPWRCGPRMAGEPGLVDRRPEWPVNVWLGTTAEDQRRADERIPTLLSLPARVRFVSYEPAIESVSFARYVTALKGGHDRGIDWLIIGGESGPGARPFAQEWAERALHDVKGTTCAPFVKQLGAYVVSEGRTVPYDPVIHKGKREDYDRFLAPDRNIWAWRAHLRDGKGGDPDEWPQHLRVRRFPMVTP